MRKLQNKELEKMLGELADMLQKVYMDKLFVMQVETFLNKEEEE